MMSYFYRRFCADIEQRKITKKYSKADPEGQKPVPQHSPFEF